MGVIRPSQDGPVPTIVWEAHRAGRNDLGYIYTLQEQIKRAEQSPDPDLVQAAQKAQSVLDAMLERIPLDGSELEAASWWDKLEA